MRRIKPVIRDKEKVWPKKDEIKRELVRPGLKWKEIIKVNLTQQEAVRWINLTQSSIRQLFSSDTLINRHVL